jgi:FkbM family methyltransferase
VSTMAGTPIDRVVHTAGNTDFLRAALSRVRRWREAIRGKCGYLVSHPGFRRAPLLTLSRLLWWRLHCALGIPATLTLQPWNTRFYLPPVWHGVGTTMIYALRERYEKELMYLSHFISPGMVVVDGGANSGIYTVVAAKLVGDNGLVLSFEPGRQAFSVLDKNIRLNGFENVRACRAALSDKEGPAALYHHAGPNSFSLGQPDRSGVDFEEVATRTLGQIMQEQNVDSVGLIKLDVEGAEELALRGGEAMILRSHPTIILETNGAAAQRLGLSPTGAWQLLERWGYRFFSLTEQGDLAALDHPPAASDTVNLVALYHGQRQ